AIVVYLFKLKLEGQLDQQRAFLQGATKVHEQQVTALRLIHANLKRASFFFQRLSSAGKLEGESDDDLYKQFNTHIVAASDLSLDNELLLPESLTTQLESFFAKLKSAERDLGWAKSPHFP